MTAGRFYYGCFTASLFFTNQELLEMQQGDLNKLENQQMHQVSLSQPQDFALEGLIYESAHNWALWINGMLFTSEVPQNGDVQVIQVSARSVEFSHQGKKQCLSLDGDGGG